MNKAPRLYFFNRATFLALAWIFLASTALGEAPRAVAPSPPGIQPIRIALSAAFVSESGVPVFERITHYVAAKSGIPCELITGLAYGTINKMLDDGALDAAFICGLPYVIERDKPQPSIVLLAAPVMKGARYQDRPQYFSDLVVRKDSPYQRLEDLRGKIYVYNEQLSNSGYNMPRFRLVEAGETDGFFGKVLRSGSHEESIRMVAEGEADASFVDSLVLDFDRIKGFGHADKVRVIESIGPAAICPVVASVKLPEPRRDMVQETLLGMDEDPKGRQVLDDALVARFEKVNDRDYNGIRQMKKAAEDAGFNVIK
jgi:phosphonate transport system substrate-binding protein